MSVAKNCIPLTHSFNIRYSFNTLTKYIYNNSLIKYLRGTFNVAPCHDYCNCRLVLSLGFVINMTSHNNNKQK